MQEGCSRTDLGPFMANREAGHHGPLVLLMSCRSIPDQKFLTRNSRHNPLICKMVGAQGLEPWTR
jgi:hypothetical protein